jgi:hypothetical protein
MLAAVKGKHFLILRHAGERLVNDIPRDTGGCGLARKCANERVEIAAALRCAGGRRRKNHEQQCRK